MSAVLSRFLERGQVVLHLGAHKTATTYLQMALKAQRAALLAGGTAVILPSDLRRGGRAARVDEHGEAPGLEAQLFALASDPSTRRIVVSEENFIGSTGHNLTRKSLYPSILRRLGKLPGELNHPHVRILFSLRDYGPFLSSGVTTAVRRGKIFDEDALKAAFLLLHRNWVDVVEDLRGLFPAARLVLWRYEAFAESEAKICAQIDPGFAPRPQKRAFQTLSRDAMQQILHELTNNTTGELPRQIVRRAARISPISDTNPAYSLWNAEEARHLSQSYQAHWTTICDAHPGVALMGH